MKWSLRIARIAGIDVFVHATFLILVAWFLLGDLFAGHGLAAAMANVGTLFLLFGIIVLHELGHALTARRFGIRTASITLLPIGGVATMEEIPRDPLQELQVAVAGPLVNVVLAMAGFATLAATGGLAHLWAIEEFLPRFFWINVSLALFNMLPAFPMDGGRVLRALLSLRIDRVRATEIAAGIGQALALLLGLVGFFANPMLLFVAFFVWVGAESEAAMVREEDLFAGLTLGDIMAREFYVASTGNTLGEVADRLGSGFQTDIPILEGDEFVGILNLEGLARGIATSGPGARVRDYVLPTPVLANPELSLGELMRTWRPTDGSAVAVLREGEVVGLITPAVVAEHVLLRSALNSGRSDTSLAPRRGLLHRRVPSPAPRV